MYSKSVTEWVIFFSVSLVRSMLDLVVWSVIRCLFHSKAKACLRRCTWCQTMYTLMLVQ